MKKILLTTLVLGSFMAKAQGPGACTDIFISEYLEGTSNNKALELYNPTANTIDLSNYTLNIYFNGSTTPTSFVPIGMLAPGQTFTIVNASASAPLLALADTTQAVASVVSFNGDDALRLYHGTTLIDVIGIVGVDPGVNWAVGSGATSEYTLVRSATHYHGDTVWTGSADTTYIVYPQDDSSHFGSHTCIPTIDPMITTTDSVLCNDSFGMNLLATDTTGIWTGTYVSSFGSGQGFFSSAAIAPGHYIASYGGNSCIIPGVVNIYVPVPPTAGFTFAITGVNTYTFTNTSTNGSVYSWDFGGSGTSAATNPTFTFPSSSSYNVCLSVTSDSGCNALYCQTVIVTGLNDLNTETAFVLYPNPANDHVTIVSAEKGNVILRNCLGEIVLNKEMLTGTETIFVGNLPMGIYTVSVGNKAARKLVLGEK